MWICDKYGIFMLNRYLDPLQERVYTIHRAPKVPLGPLSLPLSTILPPGLLLECYLSDK